MRKLLTLGIVGLIAQLIDGALGMAYGVTSTTLLLAGGIAPAAASATVHLAELGTTLASGGAHWRFGNVDWRIAATMGIPGAAGAFLGAVVLSSLPVATAKPLVAGFLFVLGVYLLIRFTVRPWRDRTSQRPPRRRFLAPLGAFGGFMDAAGGGGWGPIGTPALLATGRIEPRKVVGSVDASEFLVALGASVGFLVALSFAEVKLAWLGALLAGGLVAAPLAAWLVRRLPAQVLGAAVGGLILLTNAKTIGEELAIETGVLSILYATLALVWAMSVSWTVVSHRRALGRPAV